jgi:hypothetical protein
LKPRAFSLKLLAEQLQNRAALVPVLLCQPQQVRGIQALQASISLSSDSKPSVNMVLARSTSAVYLLM